MTFPPKISHIFRWLSCLTLIHPIISYYINNDFHELGRSDFLFINILVCFTSYISYLNGTGRMLVIGKNIIGIEKYNDEHSAQILTHLYLLVLIIYNPIYKLVFSYSKIGIINIITLIFFAINIYVTIPIKKK